MPEALASETLPAMLPEHRALRAWRQFHPGQDEPPRIETLKRKRGKSEVYRLAGVGANATNVIAKRCPTANATVEQLVHEELHRVLPPPTLRLFGTLAEAEDDYCWLFLEDAGPGTYSTASAEQRVLAARWLAALHQGRFSTLFAEALPARGGAHYLQRLLGARARLEEALRHGPLDAEHKALLGAIVAACQTVEGRWGELEEICESWPTTLVHGDFVAKNLRLRSGAAGPALLVFDWEMAGWGSRASDLAQIPERTASPELEAYWLALKEQTPRLRLKDLEQLAACGTLLRLLDEIVWETESMADNTLRVLLKPVTTIREYEPQLAAAIRRLGWS
jgi:hypothetical protein